MRCLKILVLSGTLVLNASGALPTPPVLRVASFACEITPPVGAPMAAGLLGEIQGVEAPLQAKGVVLCEGAQRYVLCALDWCRLQNESYDLFREKLARAAETSPSRMAVHCLHQHDSFLADHTAERILQQQPSPPKHLDRAFFDRALENVTAAVRAALLRQQVFDHVAEIGWATTEVRLPPRSEDRFLEPALLKVVANPAEVSIDRIKAAWALAWRERVRTNPALELSRLRLGPVQILHLPGEPMVAFQRYAQQVRPDQFVAVAAYGDSGTGYICTEAAFAEGGYEPTVSWVGPPAEKILQEAIDRLLR